jgi:CcmD family protein
MKTICLSVFLLMTTMLVAQQPQSEFLPVKEVPASEQLPAAPLVIAAYAFVWIAFLAYVWLMWRRLGKVEQELSSLSVQLSKKRP